MREPYFWQVRDRRARASAPLTRFLLTPLASIYAAAGRNRIKKTTPFKASIPVICVGNLTVGGSGKTPVVAALRAWFVAKGIRAASLSRGYKGEHKGPLKVDVETHTARMVGDEPLMLSRTGEAWIGADREEAARVMAHMGVELIIMDDGHQNPTLHKDVSIVVIDGGNPVGNGYIFPKGPLREPVGEGLGRADAVIIMGELAHDLAELEHFSGPTLKAAISPMGPAPGGPLVAFAGIGRPQKFFDTLEQQGAELSEAVPYPDHHSFSEADISFLRRLAEDHGAQLVTTEKDYVRLSAEQREGIKVYPVEVVLSSEWLDQCLGPVLERLS